MRTHLQGAFLLIVLLLAFWWALNWAGPIFDSALGEDGAIVVRAPLEQENPADADRTAERDEALDGSEVAELQGALIQVGYNPGPVDGILGELTRAAVEEAKEDLGLAAASDRRLLETLETALGAIDSAPDSDEPGP